jgi:transcriptional regulator with XRE-family HTH domain
MAKNMVQLEIVRRLSHGLTQVDLAKELGIAKNTLHMLLHGTRKAGPGILKKLGIQRKLEYSYIGTPPEDVRKSSKVPRPAPIEAKKPILQKSAPTAIETPKLTVERIHIAMRYGLNPSKSWETFIAAYVAEEWPSFDEGWLAFCEHNGSAPPSIEAESPFAPGELYSHLKAVKRPPDHRGMAGIQTPNGTFTMGFQPPTTDPVPEVSLHAMSAAEAKFRANG